MRIFLCRLFHETNGFAPGVTAAEHFTRRRRQAVVEEANEGSLIPAIQQRVQEVGCSLIPSFDIGASPGPTVPEEIVDQALRYLDEDLPAALADGIDGVYVILHGAMVSEVHDDVEGVLLERISHHLAGREIPVAATLDLHANVSQKMAENANILLAYRCNPHTDAVEAGIRTFDLLLDSIKSRRLCRTQLIQAPILLPPTGTSSAEQPMSGLLEIARRHEGDVLPAISVCAGFSHADTPYTGLSFQIVTRDPGNPAVVAAANELLACASQHAAEGIPQEWDLDEAIRDALSHADYPTLLVEPADNIGGGAPGDATWILQALLRHDVERSGVIIAAPKAVRLLQTFLVGATTEVIIGGDHPDFSGPALTLSVTIVRHSDGTFDVEDRHSHFVAALGTRIHMGPSTLVESNGVLILLTTRRMAPNDLGQWRCVGVNPESLQMIGVKAAVAHRQAYDPITRRSYTVSTPGPCTSNLHSLPYRKLRRPIFPLDELMPEDAHDTHAR